MNSPIKPNRDRLVVKLIEEEETRGNIIIPSEEDQALLGEVIASGLGFYLPSGDFVENQCMVGDKVLLPKFGTHKITWECEEYVIVHENDILGTLKNKDNE